MKAKLLGSIVNLMWEAIPADVTTIDLGDNNRVTRSNIDPNHPGETWNLTQIDQRGAKLAAEMQQPWEPIFPPADH